MSRNLVRDDLYTRVYGDHERGIRASKQMVPGEWTYVGTYPGGDGTTPDSPPFKNGWTTVSADPLRFRWLLDGRPEIRGRFVGGSANTVVFTLPEKARPDNAYVMPYSGLTNCVGSITIQPNGDVTWHDACAAGAGIPTDTDWSVGSDTTHPSPGDLYYFNAGSHTKTASAFYYDLYSFTIYDYREAWENGWTLLLDFEGDADRVDVVDMNMSGCASGVVDLCLNTLGTSQYNQGNLISGSGVARVTVLDPGDDLTFTLRAQGNWFPQFTLFECFIRGRWVRHNEPFGGVKMVTANYTWDPSECVVVLVDVTAASRTVFLPPAAAMKNARVVVKKAAGGNNVTVQSNGGNIDGAASIAINTLYQSREIVSDGTNWYIIAAHL